MKSCRYHGTICDFDFYVVSLSTDETTHEANAERLSLDEALQEIKRRNAYTSTPLKHVVLALGVYYSITSPEYSNGVNCGAIDMLHQKNGEYHILDDIKTDKVLMNETVIAVNAMQKIRAFAAGNKKRCDRYGFFKA